MPSPKTPPFDPPPRLNLGTFNEPLAQRPKPKPQAFDMALLPEMDADPRLLESPHSRSPDRRVPPPQPKPYTPEYYSPSPKPKAENPLPSQIPSGIAAIADYSTPKSDSYPGFSIGGGTPPIPRYSGRSMHSAVGGSRGGGYVEGTPPMPNPGSKSNHSGPHASESALQSASESGGAGSSPERNREIARNRLGAKTKPKATNPKVQMKIPTSKMNAGEGASEIKLVRAAGALYSTKRPATVPKSKLSIQQQHQQQQQQQQQLSNPLSATKSPSSKSKAPSSVISLGVGKKRPSSPKEKRNAPEMSDREEKREEAGAKGSASPGTPKPFKKPAAQVVPKVKAPSLNLAPRKQLTGIVPIMVNRKQVAPNVGTVAAQTRSSGAALSNRRSSNATSSSSASPTIALRGGNGEIATNKKRQNSPTAVAPSTQPSQAQIIAQLSELAAFGKNREATKAPGQETTGCRPASSSVAAASIAQHARGHIKARLASFLEREFDPVAGDRLDAHKKQLEDTREREQTVHKLRKSALEENYRLQQLTTSRIIEQVRGAKLEVTNECLRLEHSDQSFELMRTRAAVEGTTRTDVKASTNANANAKKGTLRNVHMRNGDGNPKATREDNMEGKTETNAKAVAEHLDLRAGLVRAKVTDLHKQEYIQQEELTSLHSQIADQLAEVHADEEAYLDQLDLHLAERREFLRLEQEYNEHLADLEAEREALEDALEVRNAREDAVLSDMEQEMNQAEAQAVRKARVNESMARVVKRNTEMQGAAARATTESQVLTYEQDLDRLAKSTERHEKKHVAALDGLTRDVSLLKQKVKVILDFMMEKSALSRPMVPNEYPEDHLYHSPEGDEYVSYDTYVAEGGEREYGGGHYHDAAESGATYQYER